MKEFWTYESKDMLKKLNADENGLSGREAEKRIDEYGQNILEERRSSSCLLYTSPSPRDTR